MKVLNFSWDSSALTQESAFARRLVEYGGLVDRYGCIVPAQYDCQLDLSPQTVVYGLRAGRKSIISRLRFLFKLYQLAAKIVRAENYQVISTQDPFELAAVAWRLARKFGLGLMMEEHGDFFSYYYWRNENMVNFGRFYLGRFLIKKADSIRTASVRIKQTLVTKFGINPEKIVAVPIYTAAKVRWGKLSYSHIKDKYAGKFIFLTLGRMVKQKNLLLLLTAYRRVAAARNDTMLILVGDGQEKSYLKKLAYSLGLGYKIEFVDWTEDVYPWYEAADCYVLSSNYEGWGRVIIEAAQTGLPIIMTDVGCAGEVIINNESGIIVPIGDEAALTAAMEKVMTDEILRKKISDTVQAAISRLPSHRETLNQYQKCWQSAQKPVSQVPTV